MKAKAMRRVLDKAPSDPYVAFGWFVSRCASGLHTELVGKGKTDTEARNAVIHLLLAMAAGEACRVARREGREPDVSKWGEATMKAFDRALKRTDAAPPQS